MLILADHWEGATLTMPSGEEIEVDINLSEVTSETGTIRLCIYPVVDGKTKTDNTLLSISINEGSKPRSFRDDLEEIMGKHFGNEEWGYRFDEIETVLFHPEVEDKPTEALPFGDKEETP